MIPVFDGHNDFIQRVVAAGEDGARIWLEGDGTGHLDLPRARAGGLVGGFFALWVPSPANPNDVESIALMQDPPFHLPLPDEIAHDSALPFAFRQAAALKMLERTGTLEVVTSATGLRRAIAENRFAAVMHMEGAEAIRDMDALHLWHAAGLRSLGPVWSRPTAYGEGVPFAYPAGPDIGAGLTPQGRDLVRECNVLRIMLDLSHLNEAGFDDVARLSDAPLVASHSCVHAICPSARNLTDRQLQVIRDSGGLVGLNYASSFLREDGKRLPLKGFDTILRHLDRLLAVLGEDGVGLGSDFDGALMPEELADAAALPALIRAMEAHGYGDALIRKIAGENWISLLARVWGN
ncbi:MAG: dipeptidase [Paracoccus sp. (in: a-proteobacteria)]|jgi:membrane dipeptidase|uniref:dipeptidase n=3 Tax=Paracoccus TaxID=265 RepID=UPI000C50790D|nr:MULTISPECIES: membrane dipeptidase [unclassified Paracoccus (in: a-proteobacteria)]MAN55362.1 peptidase [Paracoccus sp. (in: a-proteobacteria)]MBA48411.1 peptidase [Paracoccus sp. (in: a-proteobacteria)]HIC66867.1 peptidase [Paracoccus sp. (in: a-proteobacteria)]|tara:strand:+ start:2698 stop:3747 length:1050 start_codon:yes stop_codon:yes gene_type:complete